MEACGQEGAEADHGVETVGVEEINTSSNKNKSKLLVQAHY